MRGGLLLHGGCILPRTSFGRDSRLCCRRDSFCIEEAFLSGAVGRRVRGIYRTEEPVL